MMSQATRIDLIYRAEYNITRNRQRVKISRVSKIHFDKI